MALIIKPCFGTNYPFSTKDKARVCVDMYPEQLQKNAELNEDAPFIIDEQESFVVNDNYVEGITFIYMYIVKKI